MLPEFLTYLEAERRYSPLTIRNYRRDIERFLAWLGVDEASFDPSQLRTEDIREWILYRTEKSHIGPASMNREVSSLRALWHYLRRQGIVTQDIFRSVRSLRTPRRLPVFVPESRMAYVIADINGRAGSEDFVTVRDALTVAMFYGCGIRLAELIALNRNDFSDDYRQVRIRGKGDKERIVPLVDPLRRILVHYLQLIERQKHLQFSGKSTNFNTERSAHFTERRASHRGTGVEQGGRTGKKEPPRTAAHLCDASAEPRRGHARNTGAVGTLLVAGHAGLHPQQHHPFAGDLRQGAPPRAEKGRD